MSRAAPDCRQEALNHSVLLTDSPNLEQQGEGILVRVTGEAYIRRPLADSLQLLERLIADCQGCLYAVPHALYFQKNPGGGGMSPPPGNLNCEKRT